MQVSIGSTRYSCSPFTIVRFYILPVEGERGGVDPEDMSLQLEKETVMADRG